MLVLPDQRPDGVSDLESIAVLTREDFQSRFPKSGWVLDYRPRVHHAPGLVVSDAPLATQVGVEILRAGGNAVDAAVATAFALAAVYPRAGNLGGGGFLVARIDGADFALDFRETAPAAAASGMYDDAPADSRFGLRSCAVPGSVAGLYEVHRRFGRLPWNDVVVPAEILALDGFVVDADFRQALLDSGEPLRHYGASIQLFLPGGEAPEAGARWSNPDLAATLRRIAERGAEGFYAGETAAAIVATMRGGGLITGEDLAAYRALARPPLVFEYRGHRVLAAPAPSGGPVLAMLCRLLEPFDLAAAGHQSPAHLHLLAEALRRAFAARNAYLGDPGFTDPPLELLLSEDWAGPQRATISSARASSSDEIVPGPGMPPGGVGAGKSGHTTHLSVVDSAGNAVALTTTLNDDFGSGVTVAGAGFLLNNEMDDFTSQPGQPNLFGLVQGEPNAIAPGKRPLSSMCPMLVTDPGGRIVLVAGAAGGPRIISAVFQVLSNVLDFGLDAPAAVA
ncbi:MAG TPA: gamma-glutamyltransferase, partial [Planctomycetota bacterium]|nr:gamma-glutamyltransferase [Planctomycetota bacterium]